MWQFRSDFPSCSESAEIWHVYSFCVKRCPWFFFQECRKIWTKLWQIQLPPSPPPPPPKFNFNFNWEHCMLLCGRFWCISEWPTKNGSHIWLISIWKSGHSLIAHLALKYPNIWLCIITAALSIRFDGIRWKKTQQKADRKTDRRTEGRSVSWTKYREERREAEGYRYFSNTLPTTITQLQNHAAVADWQ